MINFRFTIARILRHSCVLLAVCCISSTAHAWQSDQRAPWVGKDANGTVCTGIQIPFGPFDYLQRGNLPAELNVVEETHFSPEIESLQAGQTSSAIADINYTLMAWPNHHRALQSAMQYRLQHRGPWPRDSGASPVECYLQRAMKFSPNDAIPPMLYGLLLHKYKQYSQALAAYRIALRLRPEDLITKYNMGLALVEVKQYKEAEQIATEVYAAGFPLPGLKNKLAAAAKQKPANATAAAESPTSAEDKTKAAPGDTVAQEKAKTTGKQPEFTAEQLQTLKNALEKAAKEKAAGSPTQ